MLIGDPDNTGEVASPLPIGSGKNVGELRLQSDFEFSRDERTACFWQEMIGMLTCARVFIPNLNTMCDFQMSKRR